MYSPVTQSVLTFVDTQALEFYDSTYIYHTIILCKKSQTAYCMVANKRKNLE